MFRKILIAASLFIFIEPLIPIDVSYAATTTNSSIIYSGTLPSNQVHTYRFKSTKEGIVGVKFLSTSQTLHTITNIKSGESYRDGDILPIGEYDFDLSPTDSTNISYKVELIGDLGLIGQTNLPNLSVTSPSNGYTRLDNYETSILFSGSSNADITNYIVNHQSPISLGSNFSKKVDILFGQNLINTKAELSNNNRISDIREVVTRGVKRISGGSRYETAVETSKEIEKEGYIIDTVVITAGDTYLDAVPGIVLAHSKTAPILLTNSASLPNATKNEIIRLKAKNAIILGAPGVVSAEVENQLISLGLDVSRISGNTRFDTAVKIANEVITKNTNRVIIVNESSWVDGLAIAPYAANTETPILYTNADSIPPDLQRFLDHRAIDEFILIGGTIPISKAVEDKISKYGVTYRVDGTTKYDTVVNIPKALDFHQDRFVLFSNSVDGISASLLASYKKANLLLTNTNSLPSQTDQYLQGYANDGLLENVYLLGGTNVIPGSTETYVRGLFK
ncbi:cell wall-binding repeat-containing protein [Rossellomorea marisflavi]|uniref:cell wall-binding repeat-containing protein n=1 Tax=Rossellomorea marisflavi TaxID=189381 RepID=UPI00069D42D9|nr:cell wall-binding repeat-containing protein [Rossellomorea marisflavi]